MQKFRYYTIPPPDTLKRYVRAFWVFEGSNLGGAPYVYRSMADACAEMVFHYKGMWHQIDGSDNKIDGTSTTATLQSPTNAHSRFVTCDDFGIFGAYLYPFALYELFGLSAAELQAQMPDIADCLGAGAAALGEQIMLAASGEERARLLSAFLLTRKKWATVIDGSLESCIRFMLHSREPFTIAEASSRFCISTRQMERKFKTLTGFSPKSFARISRFQHALRTYGQDYKSLTQIAYDCGYYDQSHFINDFKEFSGYEPRAYFAGRSEGIEYRQS